MDRVAGAGIPATFLGTNDVERAISIPFDNGRRYSRGLVVLAVLNNVVNTVFYFNINIGKNTRRGVARNIGGGGNNGFAEAFDEIFAKPVAYDADGNAVVLWCEVWRQPNSAFVNDRGGFVNAFDIIVHPWVGLGYVFDDIPFIGQ